MKGSIKNQIEGLGFTIFSGNTKAYHVYYGVCYGKGLTELLNDIKKRIAR
jgi:hypothetical protein